MSKERLKKKQLGDTISKEKNKVGVLTLADFKTYHKVSVTKKVWHWWKDTQIHGTERAQKETRNKHIQVTFDKGAKVTQWRKDGLFNKRSCNNRTSTCKRMMQTQTSQP